MRGTILAATAIAATLIAGAACAAPVYSNDFSTNTAGFTLSGGAGLENAFTGSERYIGGLTQGAMASLTLDTTGLTTLTLSFDLYGILSIDGSNPGTGPDSFQLSVSGGPVLLDETFSNFIFQSQTYGPNASDPGRTGASATGHLGYQWPGYTSPDGADTTYHFTYTFAATGNSTVLNFVGASN